MLLPSITYRQPATTGELLDLLQEFGDKAAVIAGGSDLIVQLKNNTASVSHLIDLGAVQELNYIQYDRQEGLKIGAATTLLEIIRNKTIKEHYPALVQAADAVGAFQHQAMGTIGGNLCLNTRCWYFNQSASWRKSRETCFKMGGNKCHAMPKSPNCHASYCGDTAGMLIAYGATVTLEKKGSSRTINLEELYSGDGKAPHRLQPGEILTEIRVPAPEPEQRSIYLKLRQRNAIDFPEVGVALNTVWNGKGCSKLRLVLTAVAPRPVVVTEAEAIVRTRGWDAGIEAEISEAALKAGKPVPNMAGSVSYRKKMLGMMTQQAIDAVNPAKQ